MKKTLIVIDIQNDYFPGGAFTLENADAACEGAVECIEQAKREDWLVVGVQHVNPAGSPLFQPDTDGMKFHPAIEAALGDAPIVVKHQADSFFETNLGEILSSSGITDIWLTGMMTQHCVTHTALSQDARDMKVHIVAKGCAAPSKGLSDLALKGLSARCDVV